LKVRKKNQTSSVKAAGNWWLTVNAEVAGGECRWWLPSLTFLD